jgi:hypothetical protein
MPLPAATIPLLRTALQSQGFSADVIDAAGNVNFGALASTAYDTVEFRTAITPPITVKLTEAGNAEPGVASWMKPMAIFRGKAGQVVVAPAGAPGNFGWVVLPAIALGLVGIGYFLGRR